MFKKFLLVTSALVAVHATENPHAGIIDDISKLSQKVLVASNLLDITMEENTNLTRTVTFLNGKITELESDLSAQKAKASKSAQLQLELGTAQLGLTTAQREHDRLSDQIAKTSLALETANATVAALQDELKTAVATDSTIVADLHAQLEAAQNDIQAKQLELETMQSQLGTSQEQFQIASSALDTANASVAALQDELKTAADKGSSTVTDLQTQLEAAQNDIQAKQLELQAMQSKLGTSQEQFQIASSALDTANASVAALEGGLEAAKAEHSSEKALLEEQLETATKETQAKVQELESKQRELRTTNRNLSSKTEDLDALKAKYDTAAEMLNVKGNNARLDLQFSKAQATILQLEAQLAEKSAAAEAPRRSDLDGIIAEILAKARYSDADGVEDLLLEMLPVLDQNRIRANRPGYYELIGRLVAGAIDIR